MFGPCKDRCLNPSSADYPDYGKRGIKVFVPWAVSFERFLADVGPRPSGTSLDRIDNNGDYAPGNVKWSTPTEQARNRRSNVMLTHGGVTQSAEAWGEALGLSGSIVRKRLRRGWSVADAVTAPKQTK